MSYNNVTTKQLKNSREKVQNKMKSNTYYCLVLTWPVLSEVVRRDFGVRIPISCTLKSLLWTNIGKNIIMVKTVRFDFYDFVLLENKKKY
jgi:hypothetical protein